MVKLNWLRIPQELRDRKQWAVSTLNMKPDGTPDKAPRNPHTGWPIDPTDPESWFTFDQVINSGYKAIGYMLHEDDPFCIIDLDDKLDKPLTEEKRARQAKIYETFDSYTERSQSGRGTHIILQGKIGGGFNRDAVEVYDQERYMICTGDVIRQTTINAYDELLAIMVHEMGGVVNFSEWPEDEPERCGDEEFLRRARGAANGEKFSDLFDRIPEPMEDWSQRDASLAQMIVFYSKNHEQILRIFRQSKLYRPKAKGKNPEHYENYYLRRTFGKAFYHQKGEDADMSVGEHTLNTMVEIESKPEFPKFPILDPGGLLGEIVKFIYDSMKRPSLELAVAGGLAFLAGTAGRQYNVSSTGLNLYIVVVAKTGMGKEGVTTGINALMSGCVFNYPRVFEFQGPARLASGQALIKLLSAQPCCLSIFNEFGEQLASMVNSKASEAQSTLRQILLDIYSKSGRGQSYHGMAYADSTRNVPVILSPSFSFYADSTPETYYGTFRSKTVASGLIPRLLTIHYKGKRPRLNNFTFDQPSSALVDRICELLSTVGKLAMENKVLNVLQDAEATKLLSDFNEKMDDLINEGSGDVFVELANRGHLKALKIAALIAVGKKFEEPEITADDARWAINLVELEIENTRAGKATGQIGTDAAKQEFAVEKAARDYLRMPLKGRASYCPKALLKEGHLIPESFFRKRLLNLEEFNHIPNQTNRAIESALETAVRMDILQVLSQEQAKKYKLRQRIYTIGTSLREKISPERSDSEIPD